MSLDFGQNPPTAEALENAALFAAAEQKKKTADAAYAAKPGVPVKPLRKKLVARFVDEVSPLLSRRKPTAVDRMSGNFQSVRSFLGDFAGAAAKGKNRAQKAKNLKAVDKKNTKKGKKPEASPAENKKGKKPEASAAEKAQKAKTKKCKDPKPTRAEQLLGDWGKPMEGGSPAFKRPAAKKGRATKTHVLAKRTVGDELLQLMNNTGSGKEAMSPEPEQPPSPPPFERIEPEISTGEGSVSQALSKPRSKSTAKPAHLIQNGAGGAGGAGGSASSAEVQAAATGTKAAGSKKAAKTAPRRKRQSWKTADEKKNEKIRKENAQKRYEVALFCENFAEEYKKVNDAAKKIRQALFKKNLDKMQKERDDALAAMQKAQGKDGFKAAEADFKLKNFIYDREIMATDLAVRGADGLETEHKRVWDEYVARKKREAAAAKKAEEKQDTESESESEKEDEEPRSDDLGAKTNGFGFGF
jgi:hypothetical protein